MTGYLPILGGGGGGGTDPLEIVESSSLPYTHLGTEDVVILTGTGDFDLLLSASATKGVIVHAETGTVTVVPQGGDTVSQTTITVGNSASYYPLTGKWVAM